MEVETVKRQDIKNKMIIEKSPGSLSKKEIEERLQALKDIKIHPRERQNRLLLAKGERLYEESLSETRTEIAMLLHKFESVLAMQNEKDIKKAAAELKIKLSQMERWHDQ